MSMRTIHERARLNPAAAILWASAFLLLALVIMQAGRLAGPEAHAGMATSRQMYTAITSASGLGESSDPDELLFLVDSRDEVLLVYEVEDPRQGAIRLRDGGSLAQLFATARR